MRIRREIVIEVPGVDDKKTAIDYSDMLLAMIVHKVNLEDPELQAGDAEADPRSVLPPDTFKASVGVQHNGKQRWIRVVDVK